MNCKYQTYKTILRHVHNFISGWFLNHDLSLVIIHNFFPATMTTVFPFSSFSPILGPEKGTGFFSPFIYRDRCCFSSKQLSFNAKPLERSFDSNNSVLDANNRSTSWTNYLETQHAQPRDPIRNMRMLIMHWPTLSFFRNRVIRGWRWR